MDNVPLTPEEKAVWDDLSLCHGQQYARPRKAIEESTGLNERAVKRAVEGLRLRHNYKIGSSRVKPCGYYVIKTAMDLKATEGPYFSQAVQMMRVNYALNGKKKSYLRKMMGQMELEITREPTEGLA